MRLKELIEEAEEALKENGDIEVSVYADHGQSEQRCYGTSISYIDSGGDLCSSDELDGSETKVLSINGRGLFLC